MNETEIRRFAKEVASKTKKRFDKIYVPYEKSIIYHESRQVEKEIIVQKGFWIFKYPKTEIVAETETVELAGTKVAYKPQSVGGWILKEFWEEEYDYSDKVVHKQFYILKKNGDLVVCDMDYEIEVHGAHIKTGSNKETVSFRQKPTEYAMTFTAPQHFFTNKNPDLMYLTCTQHSAYILDYECNKYKVRQGSKYDYFVRNFPNSTNPACDKGYAYRIANTDGDGIVMALKRILEEH